MKHLMLSITLGLVAPALMAATPAAPMPALPGTDIWLAELETNDDRLAAVNPRNVTNRRGYDNQPAFIAPGVFLFTAADEDGQTDAWRHEPGAEPARVRDTAESEYSPTPVPGGGMSVVRVAPDGTQQLWWLPPSKPDFELLFPLLEGVGYHAWIDSDRVALFMVRDPAELHIANRRSGEVTIVASEVGRSLHAVPDEAGSIAFIEPGTDERRWIKQLNLDESRITPLAPVIEGSQDFVFTPDGRLLMAQGKRLFEWQDDEWRMAAHFEQLPGDITRLAVSPDASRLAMVVGEAD